MAGENRLPASAGSLSIKELEYGETYGLPGRALLTTIGLSGFSGPAAFDLILLEVVQLGDAGLVEGELFCFDGFHND